MQNTAEADWNVISFAGICSYTKVLDWQNNGRQGNPTMTWMLVLNFMTIWNSSWDIQSGPQ